MKINHIAMYVSDLEKSKIFYEKYFNAKSTEKYNNPYTGLETYFLLFDDNTKLEIMSRPNLSLNKNDLTSCGFIHLAFSVGNKENVDEITNKLKNDGYTILREPKETADSYESLILDLDNNQIEVTI